MGEIVEVISSYDDDNLVKDAFGGKLVQGRQELRQRGERTFENQFVRE